MRGYVEAYENGIVKGWLVAEDLHGEPLQVAVYINAEKVAEGTASLFREDLLETGASADGFCGFSIPFVDEPIHDQRVLRVVEAESGWEVPPGHIVIEGPAARHDEMEGAVDQLSPWGTSGWARYVDGRDVPVRVEVLVNNAVVAAESADEPRPDLYPDGNERNRCGYVIRFDNLMAATAVVRVQAVCDSGALTLFEGRPLSIEGYVDTVSKGGASGWAWTPIDVNEHLIVEAHVRNRVIASAVADEFRQDLQDSGRGSGVYGFNLEFNPPLAGGEAPTFFALGARGKKLQLAAAARVDVETSAIPTQSGQEPPRKEKGITTPSLEIEGFVDQISRSFASGWVWRPNSPDQTLEVEAVLNGTVIGRTFANQLRPDLLEFRKGTGQYGFAVKFAKPLEDTVAPILRVIGPEGTTVIENNAVVRLDSRPQKTALEGTYLPDAEGYVDHLTRRDVRGWVWFPSAPEQFAQVEAVLDGKVIGRSVATTLRQDLADHKKGSGKYGFKIEFDELITGNNPPEIRALPGVGHLLKGSVSLPQPSPNDRIARPNNAVSVLLEEHRAFTTQGSLFEEFDETILDKIADTKLDQKTPLLIAFYLPQFHAIEENDAFWGKGFTEWRQLPKGMPRFPGHYQPRIPRDLGFYNLEDLGHFRKQVAMAKSAGLHGFAYYYYWFNQKRVLERPLELLLDSDVDMPFMLIWANENWTRTWDGSESQVLLKQDYKSDDDEALVEDLARHFLDNRYIRINNRPLFVIYNPNNIPESAATIRRWREMIEERIGIEPLIFMAQAFAQEDPRPYGLDGALEFPPHKLSKHLPGRPTPDAFSTEFAGRVIAYDDFVNASLDEDEPEDFPLIKTIVPSWDNDCRRPNRGLTLEGIAPQKYQGWLAELINRAMDNPIEGTPIVAINAWNEWAESAYLEPDVYFGAAFLNATARAYVSAVNARAAIGAGSSTETSARPRVSVIFPNYNHEKFLPERINSVLNQTIPPDEIIFLDDCSSDNSLAVARELLENSRIPHQIVVNKKNSGGVFRQWMKGMSLARHELIWVAETDDSVDRRFLSNILPSFRRDDVMVAFGRITCIGPDGAPRGDLDKYFDGLKDFSWSYSRVIPAYRAFSGDFAVKNVIPNASGVVFRKTMLTDEEQARLFKYRFAGDWYFYSLAARGGSIAYSRRARSLFRINSKSASHSLFFTDQHLSEHQMIIEDLRREYSIDDAAIARHSDALLPFLPEQTSDALRDSFLQKAAAVEGRQMRVCIAAHGFAVGGGEIMPVELANKLKSLGVHVTYLVIERPKAVDDNQIRKRLRNDIPVIYWENIADDFAGFINNYGIQVLNSHNVSVDFRLFLRSLQFKIPYIASLHGGYETVPDLLTPEFCAYLSRSVTKWLYLAERNFAFLPEELREPERFLQSFNAVPPLQRQAVNRGAFREDYGIAAEAFVFVLCSRAVESKGWRIAIEVVLELSARGHQVHLVLIGDGPIAGELKLEYGTSPCVTFLGHVDSPMRYFGCFDMGIFPTQFEGETFPLFLLECFACGLPIATTGIGEIPRVMEAVLGRAPGLVIDHRGKPEKLVADFLTELEDMFGAKGAYATYRVGARQASERFSIDMLADLYKTTFHDVLEAKQVES